MVKGGQTADGEPVYYFNIFESVPLSKAPADPDDAAGELCIQPVTCCLSVTKPVKGELIIPAG